MILLEQCRIIEKTFEVYKKCDVKSFPIDCIEIIKSLGISLYKYSELSAPKIKKCLLVSNDAFTLQGVIFYNDNFPLKERQRFSLMHEVGHIILEHNGECKEFEEEADIFASFMLAPRIIIHKFKCQNADQIRNMFGLSYAASNRALISYKRWFQNICRTTREPSKPELELEQIFFLQVKGVAKNKLKKSMKLSLETEKCITFFEELNQEQGYDYMFQRAESQWLYRNDY